MKNRLFVLFCLASVCLAASAEYQMVDPGPTSFDMKPIPEFIFPERDFRVTDFGAMPDGSNCTEAFAKAIAACHDAGGGRVVVPAGEWYDVAEEETPRSTGTVRLPRRRLSMDRLHPNALGHERLARTMASWMLTVPPDFKRNDGLFDM